MVCHCAHCGRFRSKKGEFKDFAKAVAAYPVIAAFDRCAGLNCKYNHVMCGPCYRPIVRALADGALVVDLPAGRPKGRGLFAVTDLEAHCEVARYGGLIITENEAKKLPAEAGTHFRRFMKGLVIDGALCFRSGPNRGLASMANHALSPETPNAELVGHTTVPSYVALRTLERIAAGREILVNYGRDYALDDILAAQQRSRRGRPRKRYPRQLTPAMKRLIGMDARRRPANVVKAAPAKIVRPSAPMLPRIRLKRERRK